jgi:hypothetical protein
MRIQIIAFIALLSGFGSALATQNPPPTDASIHVLLQATQAHKTLDAMVHQMDTMMRKSVPEAIQGQPLDAGAQKIVDGMMRQLNTLLKQQISWDKMEPMYISLYRKTFTQKEIDDMLIFYRSPSGRSMIEKMPALVAESMQTAQSRMTTLVPQLQQVSQDTSRRLEAYEANKKKTSVRSPAGAASAAK